MTLKRISLVVFCLLAMTNVASAATNWDNYVKGIRAEAIAQGIRAEVFDQAFANVKPSKKVVSLDRNQPETRLTFDQYRSTRIDPYRITIGAREFKKRRQLLNKIGGEFGVNPCVITALWGIESSYGRFMGSFPVIASLATLAYDGRRADFFRKELFLALHILNGDHVKFEKFKGEWAGASGHAQFLPSSWHNFAVDYNGDGRKDIWNDLDDVFASIANYLVKNGWRENEPWGVEVDLPVGFDQSAVRAEKKLPIEDWIRLGVLPKRGFEFPEKNLEATIMQPYGGPVFLMFHNYWVFLKYNNSRFYAGSVGYLADSICKKVN